MKACFRWVCRPYSNFEPDMYAIKVVGPSVLSIRLIHELYPTSKFLFMYRGVEKNAKSIYRLAQELTLVKIAFSLAKYSGFFVELCLNGIGFSGKDFRAKTIDDIDIAIFVWVVMVKEYITLRRSGFPASAVRYEDIIDDSRNAIRAILEYCELPVSLTDNALRGLEVDSQRNSPISREILGRHKEPELTSGARKRGNELMLKNGLPLIESDGLLEGTITHMGYRS
jgi:hypothetical protein